MKQKYSSQFKNMKPEFKSIKRGKTPGSPTSPKPTILIFSPEHVPWLLQTIDLLVSLLLKVNKMSLLLNRRHTLTFHRIITWPHVKQHNPSLFRASHTA